MNSKAERTEVHHKHKKMCEANSRYHSLQNCPYNTQTDKNYFQAGCCGRWVKYYVAYDKCTKCARGRRRKDPLSWAVLECGNSGRTKVDALVKLYDVNGLSDEIQPRESLNAQLGDLTRIVHLEMGFGDIGIKPESLAAFSETINDAGSNLIGQVRHEMPNMLSGASTMLLETGELLMGNVVNTVRASIASTVTECSESAFTILAQVLACMATCMAGRKDGSFNMSVVLSSIAQLCLSLGIVKSAISTLITWVTGIADRGLRYFLASGVEGGATLEDGVESMGTVIAAVVTVMSVVCLRSAPPFEAMSKYMTMISKGPSFVKEIASLGSALQYGIKCAIHFIKNSILGFDCAWVDDDNLATTVSKWREECVVVLMDKVNDTNSWTVEHKIILTDLRVRGDRILLDCTLKEPPAWVKARVAVTLKSIEILDAKIAASGVCQTQRAPPLAVMIAGATGTAKSLLTPFLVASYLKSRPDGMGPHGTVTSNTYTRTGQKYWEGYTCQPVLVIDDFGQQSDSVANPNQDFIDVVRIVNTVPYIMEMAQAQDKGKTAMKSELMICTTNTMKHRINSLTHAETVYRRFDYAFRIMSKDRDMVDGVLDTAVLLDRHVTKQCECDSDEAGYTKLLCKTAFTFSRHEYQKGADAFVEVEPGLTWEQMTTMINVACAERRARGAELMASVNAYATLETSETTESVYEETIESFAGVTGSFYGSDERRALTQEWVDTVLSQIDDGEAEHDFLFLRQQVNEGIPAKEWNKTDRLFAEVLGPTGVPRPPMQAKGMGHKLRLLAKQSIQKIKDYLLGSPVATLLFAMVSTVVLQSLVSYVVHMIGQGIVQTATAVSTNIGDLVRSHVAGGKVFTSWEKQEGVRVSDTPNEVYIRIDKGKVVGSPVARVAYTPTTALESPTGDEVPFHASSKGVERRKGGYFVKLEGGEDRNLSDVERKVMGNMLDIYLVSGDQRCRAGTMTMMTGHVGVTFMHWTTRKFDSIVLKRCIGGLEYPMLMSELKVHQLTDSNGEKRDLAIMVVPRKMPQFPSVVNHVWKLEDEQRTTRLKTQMMTTRELPEGCVMRLLEGSSKASDFVRTAEPKWRGAAKVVMLRDVYESTFCTDGGDCGSPVLCVDRLMARKLMAIHVASDDFSHYSLEIPLYQEDILAVLEEATLEDNAPPESELTFFDAQLGNVVNEKFFPVGAIGNVGMSISQPTESRVKPSPVHGKIVAEKKAPVQLRGLNRAGIPVREAAVLRYAFPVPLVDQKLLKDCMMDTCRVINACSSEYDARLLTLDEAIFGGEMEYYGSLNTSTSAGYPWQKMTTLSGKKGFVNLDSKWTKPILVEVVTERIEAAKRGVRSATIWSDGLKDETKEWAKCDRPRLFTGCPIDFTVAFRMYFGAFIGHVTASRAVNGVMVGINVHGLEWTNLRSWMRQASENVICGDFSNYDGTLCAELVYSVLDVAQSYYGGHNKADDKVRAVLWLEIVNAMHLNGSDLYMMGHGNPSGNPMTSILNSIAQLVAFRYVWCRAGRAMGDLDQVRLAVYGDDNMISIRDDAVDPAALTAGYAELGMKYTNSDKSGPATYGPFSSAVFLKRKFVYAEDTGRVMAPKELGDILEIASWTQSRHKWDNTGPDTLDAVVRELAHRSEEEYDQWTRCVARHAECQMRPLHGWSTYRKDMLKESYLPW